VLAINFGEDAPCVGREKNFLFLGRFESSACLPASGKFFRGNVGQRMMLIEFDQTTMANMTAALEHACNKLPPGKDTHENRKRIADAMIAYARSGTLSDFESLGSKTLEEITG
jgi:hypothetical protein